MNTQTATVTAINPALEIEATNSPMVNVNNTSAMVLNGDSMEKMLKFSEMMATSKITIPKHLQGNAGDCFAIVMQAMQWGMNPFAVAQKTHLVNGVLGYEAQLVNAVINSRAPITTRLNYEWFGDWSKVNGKTSNSDDIGVIVSATMRGESEPRTLSISMAQVGTVRNSPLWVNDPRQQLAYLATKRWSRLYCPDVILGVYTADEFEDAQPKDVTPKSGVSKTASIRDKVAAKKQGQVIDQEATKTTVAKEDDTVFESALQSLEQSQTIDELKAHGKEIAESGFTEPQIADLTVTYKARLKELQDIAAFEAQEAERLASME